MEYESLASKKHQDLLVTENDKTYQPCFIAVDIVIHFSHLF